MPSFFFALLGAAVATFGGREAVRVARLSAALGAATPLLVAAWLACLIACGMAAWLGGGLARVLAPEAKTMLVAIALGLAALDLALVKPGRAPAEPTRAFGAMLLVLAAAQLSAAAGLLVFALATALPSPWLAAVGGVAGSGAVLTAAWGVGAEWEARLPLRLVRLGTAGLLVATALIAALSARGVL